MTIRDSLPPERFAALLNEGLSVEEIVKPYGSRSRGYQIFNEYKLQYPDLFPQVEMTKEAVTAMLASKPLYEIAGHFGVSINTLKRRMECWALEKVPLKDKLTADVLQKKVDAGLSDEDIAKAHACSIHTVMKLRYEHKIYRRLKSEDRQSV